MLKPQAFAPISIGRISMGDVIENNGELTPIKYNQFVITKRIRGNDGWVKDDLNDQLKGADSKLRSIPIRLMYDTIDNNFQTGYTAYDQLGACVCTSVDGQTANRLESTLNHSTVECPGPDACNFGKLHSCKAYGRLIVVMESDFAYDPYAGYTLRTAGLNSIFTLTSRLEQFKALSSGKLTGMPLNLIMRCKTAQPSGFTVLYADLIPRETMMNSIMEANRYQKSAFEAGIDLKAVDDAATQCRLSAMFIEPADEQKNVKDEFFGAKYAEKVIYDGTVITQGFIENESLPDSDGNDGGQKPFSTHYLGVIEKIDAITNVKMIGATTVWIKNSREFASEHERQCAIDHLNGKSAKLAQD